MGDEAGRMLKRPISPSQGFTLIEVIITIVVFGILSALAVPSMSTWISNVKVRTVADGLQNGIRLAQAESLRRSRQVVFSLTNSPAPQTSLTAAAGGAYWSVNVIPSMTDNSEAAAFFVESGVLTASTSTGVTISGGPAEICFNSVGRLVMNNTTGVAGGSCNALPATTPPKWTYLVQKAGADLQLQVQVSLGGQVHMCNPNKVLSTTDPDGC